MSQCFDYACLPDATLFQLLKEGNSHALCEIHHRYYQPLFRHAGRMLDEEDDIKDLLQELFLHLWDNREELDIKTNLRAYLYVALRNRILNTLKHDKVKQRHIQSVQDFVQHGYVEADEQLRLKEFMTLVETEIEKLPQKMRLIFKMSRNEHLSQKEIAEQLNLSPLTVKRQVANSLKILRLKLGTLTSIFLIFF